MQPVLTAAAMRAADRATIDDIGLPGFTLMETAGRAAADALERAYGPAAELRVTCLCGKGNNGGDGLVVARVLAARGARVRAVLMAAPDALSPDAQANARLLLRLAEDDRRLDVVYYESLHQLAAYPPADVYVDALLGTGLQSDLRGEIADVVRWLNAQPQPTVALDVPTGLHSDTGRRLGDAVRADLTVTMGAFKAGLLLGDGPRTAGRTEVAEIGIPASVLAEAVRMHGGAWRPDDADVRAWLPRRAPDAHKYSVGMVLAVAGSRGLTGAPVMASTAAARAGAGAVVCACHEDVQEVLATKLTEVMTLALPGADDGGLDPDSALDALQARLGKARAVLVGCGLGQAEATQRFVRALLARLDVPAVIDADGLNALAGHTDLVAERAGGRWILTPHAGEFARLAGDDADLDDRIATARRHARAWNCVLLLKGMPSLVAAPDGTVYVNATGGPALATAGTGDVLAGLCAGFLAQGVPPVQAALCALHAGGAAADRYAERRHRRTMVATDLLEHLPDVFRERLDPPA